jgi:hypothetical protein
VPDDNSITVALLTEEGDSVAPVVALIAAALLAARRDN